MQAPSTITDKNARAWYEKGRVVTLEKNQIFVVDSAHEESEDSIAGKPVLLLVHGFPTSSFDWAPVWQNLASKFRLIALDMLGFGFSDKPDGRQYYSIHGQADLFDAIAREKQIESYHLLVHDYGVSVGQEMLARDAERAQPMILSSCFLNGGIFPETHRALLIQKLLLSPMGKVVNALNNFNKFSRSFSHVFGEATKPTQNELRAFWEVINYNNGKHLFHNCITYISDRRKHRDRWVSALQNSSIPIALVNGSVDPVSGAHLVDRYKELNCRLDYLKQLHEIGHYPQVEDPEGVSAAYLEFVVQQFNI